MKTESKIDNCLGAFIGLAVGDALGTTNEFSTMEECIHITDMIGGGPFELPPGYWTDDTSMALCLAESLLEMDFNINNQLSKYVQWHTNGHMSSTGECFDIGDVTWKALTHYRVTGNSLCGLTTEQSHGNGGIMRLAPVVIRYHNNHDYCVIASETQSITTHASLICREASALMGDIMFRAINKEPKKIVLGESTQRAFITPEMASINAGDYKNKKFDDVWSIHGYVASSLEFALWCFHTTNSFEECVLLAANSGGDADTNAAIAGQIAGAFYGFDNIPKRFVEKLHNHQLIIDFTYRLMRAGN